MRLLGYIQRSSVLGRSFALGALSLTWCVYERNVEEDQAMVREVLELKKSTRETDDISAGE